MSFTSHCACGYIGSIIPVLGGNRGECCTASGAKKYMCSCSCCHLRQPRWPSICSARSIRHKHDPAVRQPFNDPETHYATHGADVFNVSGIGGLICDGEMLVSFTRWSSSLLSPYLRIRWSTDRHLNLALLSSNNNRRSAFELKR